MSTSLDLSAFSPQISLLHGWLYDPAETELARTVGKLSYNQLQDWMIKNCAGPPEVVTTASRKNLQINNSLVPSLDFSQLSKCALVQTFLTDSAGQLTAQGISKLTEHMQESQLAVFFRNNHFAVLTKEGGVRSSQPILF